MKKILDKILGLPPIERRIDLSTPWLYRLFPGLPSDKTRNENYLYYLISLRSLQLHCLLGALFFFAYMASLHIDIGVVHIRPLVHSGTQRENLMNFFRPYSRISFCIFIIMSVFFIIRLLWNVRLKNYDILRDLPLKRKLGDRICDPGVRFIYTILYPPLILFMGGYIFFTTYEAAYPLSFLIGWMPYFLFVPCQIIVMICMSSLFLFLTMGYSAILVRFLLNFKYDPNNHSTQS